MRRSYSFSDDGGTNGSSSNNGDNQGADSGDSPYVFDGFNLEFSKRSMLMPPAPPDDAKRGKADQ